MMRAEIEAFEKAVEKIMIRKFMKYLEKYITWTAPVYYLKEEFKKDKEKLEKMLNA